MKASHNVMSTATRLTLVLFGIVPAVGFLLLGDAKSLVSWLEVDLILGAVFFLSYLVIASLTTNTRRLPMKKIYA